MAESDHAGTQPSTYSAENFLEFAMGMVETYDQAIRDLSSKQLPVTVEEQDRIHMAIKGFLPQFRQIFHNICHACPTYQSRQQLMEQVGRAAQEDPETQMKAFAAFIGSLLAADGQLKHKLFLISLPDVSDLYNEATPGGRANFDRRLMKLLGRVLTKRDQFLHLGVGVFLFLFDGTPKESEDSRQKIIDLIDRLLNQSKGQSAEAVAHSAISHPVIDTERAIERLLQRKAPRVGDQAAEESELIKRHRKLEKVSRQVGYQFEPVWEAAEQAVTAGLLVPARNLPNGAQVAHDEVLDRGRNDELVYEFQLWKLNAALTAAMELSIESGHARHGAAVLVTLSLAGLAQVPLERYSIDLAESLIGIAGKNRLHLMITDVDPRLPRNHVRGLMDEMRRSAGRIFGRLPPSHDYAGLVVARECDGFVVDIDQVCSLGLDFGTTARIVVKMATDARACGATVMMVNVHTSPYAELAQKSGAGFVLGKVVGPRQSAAVGYRKLSLSHLLRKL